MLPYEFIGFGAMDVTKPYEFIGFGAMDAAKPYEFIGFGAFGMSKRPLPSGDQVRWGASPHIEIDGYPGGRGRLGNGLRGCQGTGKRPTILKGRWPSGPSPGRVPGEGYQEQK